jgi:DNA mismatch endonuclease (patch repair protein)
MQRTVRKDNPFERTIRTQLHARGYRYRIHYPSPGMRRTTCDFAFALKQPGGSDGSVSRRAGRVSH